MKDVVQLLHGLGLGVVAEGVESAGESRAGNDAGCDLAQACFFGRPALPTSSPSSSAGLVQTR